MKTLSKKDACELLGISPKTLQRRMAKGQYKFTRVGEGQYAAVTFTYGDLGLSEPVEPVPAPVVVEVQVEPSPVIPQRPPTAQELRDAEDAVFADAFKTGRVTDSCGNYIDATRQTLLGHRDPEPKQKPSSTIHMNPALVGDPNVPHNFIDSDEYEEIRHPGHKERKTAMYADAGIRQPSEQEKKGYVDRAAIQAAFRQGYSR
jgi:Bacterial regulatory protein, Fis family